MFIDIFSDLKHKNAFKYPKSVTSRLWWGKNVCLKLIKPTADMKY